jgi:hypothetical protein
LLLLLLSLLLLLLLLSCCKGHASNLSRVTCVSSDTPRVAVGQSDP